MLEIQKINKSGLFFDKYRYSICVYLPGAHLLRDVANLNRDIIETRIRFNNTIRYSQSFIDVKEEQTLFDLFDLLCEFKQTFKLMCYYNWLYIYIQDYQDIVDFLSGKDKFPIISEANDIYEKNCVYLKNPAFSQRSYLQNHRLTDQELASLLNFFDTNSNDIRVNGRLNRSIHGFDHRHKSHKFVSSSDFIDHNNSVIVLMLNIIVPNLVRKTLEIKAK